MRKARFVWVWYFFLCGGLVAEAQQAKAADPQNQNPVASTEREVREFYDSYAEDLRRHRRGAIADRYDPRGVFFLGQGGKSLESFEATKNRYLTKWTGPKSFEWKDLSIEVLSPHAAVVVGRFEWQTDSGETLSYSYTGLVLQHSGRWRIRVEDESRRPPNASAK
jgi:hypothetical protein